MDEATFDYISSDTSNPSKHSELFTRLCWNTTSLLRMTAPVARSHVSLISYVAHGSYGAAFLGKYRTGRSEIDCIVKMIDIGDDEVNFKENILETMIQGVLSKTCVEDPIISAGQAAGKMSKIPDLYAMFTLRGPSWSDVTNMIQNSATKTNYIVIVMQVLDESFHTFLSSRLSKAEVVSAFDEDRRMIVAASMALSLYQISNLLDRLQVLLRFNHRDLHGGNVMVKKIPTKGSSICMNTFFETYLIDFGMSRLEFRGKVFTSFGFFSQDKFNAGHDIVMFTRSLKQGLGCKIKTDPSFVCAPMFQFFERILNSILNASGYDFVGSQSEIQDFPLYYLLQYAGDEIKHLPPVVPAYVTQAQKRPDLANSKYIHPKWVKAVIKHAIRFIGYRCKFIQPRPGVYPTRLPTLAPVGARPNQDILRREMTEIARLLSNPEQGRVEVDDLNMGELYL